MQEHYGRVKAGQQAGAVTYFGFLSFFPILALAFFVIGFVARVYPGARDDLVSAIQAVLPGIIGNGTGQLSIDDFESSAGTAGILGVVGLLYSGLGWLSALRDALTVVFELPSREQPNFVVGKLRDLVTLVVVGLVLVLAVAVTGFVAGFSTDLLDWVGLDTQLAWLVVLLSIVLGLAANSVLFFALFRLLAEPATPSRSLWSGALLGAVGFEVLKQLSGLLLASTQGQPACQAFGIALILLVWINYFSRLVLYAAAWAHTTAAARAMRPASGPAPLQGPQAPPVPARSVEPEDRRWVAPFAAGGAAMLALVAVVRKRER